MTSWSPETGERDADVITNGDEATASRRGSLFAAAVVLLAFGVGLGTRLDGWWLWREPAPSPVPLLAGTVDAVIDPGTAPDRHRFRLALFNDGAKTVEVSVRGVPGTPLQLTHRSSVKVRPHSWGYPRFTAPGECDQSGFALLSSVRVRVSIGDRTTTQRIPVRSGAALQTLHRLECPVPTALGRQELTGVWLLDEVDGRWTLLAGRQLIRFAPDGTFEGAPGGRLFAGQFPGMAGAFRLHRDRLTLRFASGLACVPGTRVEWSTTVLGVGLLRLEALRDVPCAADTNERWILRRLPGGAVLGPVGEGAPTAPDEGGRS